MDMEEVYFFLSGCPLSSNTYCRDGTNGKETYGGGRYLYDAIKGSDLGGDSAKQVWEKISENHKLGSDSGFQLCL